MTLIEIMVVVAIIGVVMGGVAVAALRSLRVCKISESERRIQVLGYAIYAWSRENKDRVCPDSLEQLFTEKYISSLPRDPWGERYLYTCPTATQSGFEIISKGRDRRAGTADDISSRHLIR